MKLPEDVSLTKEILKIRWDRLGDYAPRWNVAPGSLVPVAFAAENGRALEWMRWGLVPNWAKDVKVSYSTFNARAETAAVRPAFRGAWKAGRRCLIVTGGFYEWRKIGRQPFCIALRDGRPMMMAGLYEVWKPDAGEPVTSCTILTTAANALLAKLHDRMPVILPPEDWAAWLGETPTADPAALLRSLPAERLAMWPVDRRIGNVKNQDRAVADPIGIASSG